MSRCISCIGRYEHKTAGKCRYCVWNGERQRYVFRDSNREDKDYYKYAKDWDKETDIPY